MPQHKLLGELLYHCTKCKLELNHMITLMDGLEPARLLCLTCKTQRLYHAPKPAAKKRIVSTSTSARVSVKARQDKEESIWRNKLSDKNKTPKTYHINESFEIDQHVYHPTFGLGVVVGFAHPDKLQIYFEDGVKLLKGKKI